MAQGFVQILNLRESDTVSGDRSSLNNLGGAGISSDLELFSNNIFNTTTISANNFTVSNNYIVLDTSIYQIPFSNKTIVTHDSKELEVVNSNGVDRFQLIDSDSNIVTPNATSDVVRKDAVTLQHIRNLVSSGIPTNQTELQVAESGGIAVNESGVVVNQEGVNTGRITVREYFDRIDEVLDRYNYDRIFSIVTDIYQEFDRPINLKSTITITNDNNISLPTVAGQEDLAPGVFISSGTSAQRAFSNNNNPWSGSVPSSGYLTTSANNSTISTLILTDPDFESLSTSAILPSDVIDDYTHKIQVSVNGETYFLLCSNN